MFPLVFCLTLGIYRVNRQSVDQKFTCLATEASTEPLVVLTQEEQFLPGENTW